MLDVHNNNSIVSKKAVEALRQRLGEDAVRYLIRHAGYDPELIEYIKGYDLDGFVRLTKLRARTAEEFAIALTNAEAQDAPHWYGDARAPLPDGLKVLTLEYRYLQEPSEDSEYNFETSLFDALGLWSEHKPGEITLFGKADRTRVRVDVVMTASDYQSRSYDLVTIFDFARHSGFELVHCKIIDNLAHRYEVGDEFLDWCWFELVGDLRLRKLSGFTIDLARPGEFARWAHAAAKRAERWLALHAACNGKIREMLKVFRQKPAGRQEFVVEGLIPRKVVTLLLARKGVGKTNALLELAVAVAERRLTWWDFKLRLGNGFVVFLLGEGSKAEATERVLTMNNGERPMLLKLEKFNDSTMIEDILVDLKKTGIKVDLLIVDPGRKYYRGDEDSSDAVSEFFTKLEAFADQTGAGVIVSHHLKRDANPKNIHEVPHWLRGSQVWIDRPRVILAMQRRSNETTFGIPAPHGGDPLHNLRAATMFSDVLKLHRDADTFTHMPVNASKKSGKQAEEPEPTDDERVFAALKRLLEEGKDIGASSKYELFLYKPEELYGISRTEMRAAVQRLINAGRVHKKASGMLYLPQG